MYNTNARKRRIGNKIKREVLSTLSMKAVRSVIASNGVPNLEIRSDGSHSTSGRDEEGKKEMIFSHYYKQSN